MIMLVRVRLPVVMAVLMTGHGIRAGGMRVAHGPRMPGEPFCSTYTTTLWTHLQPGRVCGCQPGAACGLLPG